jgi:hypothetical protein
MIHKIKMIQKTQDDTQYQNNQQYQSDHMTFKTKHPLRYKLLVESGVYFDNKTFHHPTLHSSHPITELEYIYDANDEKILELLQNTIYFDKIRSSMFCFAKRD